MERPASLARLESPKIRIHGQDLAFGSDQDELTWLRRQNSSLLRQQQAHERSLKELRSELQQLHEEEVAQRVARNTHETASLVTRHEEQVQNIVQRYERQLALQAEQNSYQIELEQLRRVLAETQSRAGDAQANFEAVEVQAAKQKRKIQKLQAQRAEEVRIMRRRLRSWISSASRRAAKANAFMTWSIVVSASSLEQAELQPVRRSRVSAANAQRSLMADWTQTSHPTLLAIAGARPLLTALAALRAWAVVVARRRSEMELEAQLDQVSMQTTAALGALRAEALALRVSANRSAKAAVQTRAVLQLAAPFAVWARAAALNPWNLRKQGYLDRPLGGSARGKGASMVVRANECVALASVLHAWRAAARETARDTKHEALLQGQLDEASMQAMAALATLRADMRALRQRGRRTAASVTDLQALKAVAAPFAAWSREMILMRAKRRNTGDVVLNSGEAARRKAKQLEEVRAQNVAQVTQAQQQAADAQRAAAAASQREAEATAMAERALHLLQRLQDLTLLQMALQAWRAPTSSQAKATPIDAEVNTSLSDFPTTDVGHGEKRAAALVQHLATVAHPEQEAALLQLTLKLWSYATSATRQAWAASDSLQNKSVIDVEMAREIQADTSPIGSARVSHGDKRAAALVRHLATVVLPEQETALMHTTFKIWNYAAIATRQVLVAEAEPTRRYLAEMQGMRSAFDKQLADMRKKKGDVQKQAITAIRKEARSRALAERSKKLLFQEREYIQLLGYFYAWITAGAEVRHEQRLTTAMSETQQRHEQALACVRDESRSALKTAWSNSIDASRQAAAFERRKAAEAILAEEPRTNWMADPGERPTTAAAIERQLEIMEEEKRRQAGCFPQPIEPGCQILEIPDEAFCSRTQRRTTLESMFDRHESEWIAGPFEVWYRLAIEAKHARAVHEGNALAREARESRKGLFIAALRQQVKYWQASAFGSWRQTHMEAKCQRLLASNSQRKPSSGGMRSQRGSI